MTNHMEYYQSNVPFFKCSPLPKRETRTLTEFNARKKKFHGTFEDTKTHLKLLYYFLKCYSQDSSSIPENIDFKSNEVQKVEFSKLKEVEGWIYPPRSDDDVLHNRGDLETSLPRRVAGLGFDECFVVTVFGNIDFGVVTDQNLGVIALWWDNDHKQFKAFQVERPKERGLCYISEWLKEDQNINGRFRATKFSMKVKNPVQIQKPTFFLMEEKSIDPMFENKKDEDDDDDEKNKNKIENGDDDDGDKMNIDTDDTKGEISPKKVKKKPKTRTTRKTRKKVTKRSSRKRKRKPVSKKKRKKKEEIESDENLKQDNNDDDPENDDDDAEDGVVQPKRKKRKLK